MAKILSLDEAINIINFFRQENKKVVLAGGCFDILHQGHISFLQEAKKQGDILVVLIESDETIRKLKGNGRPINRQIDRAAVLAALSPVDYVIPLQPLKSDSEYDQMIFSLRPDIIATTAGDSYRSHKERQAASITAKVIDVITRIPDQSSTYFAEKIKRD
jgi:rfaE bifunctional protein nucleotidyltransferase chain/domain